MGASSKPTMERSSRQFEPAFVRGRHGARGHLVVGADHGGEWDLLARTARSTLLAARLVVVAFVQQAFVELHARLGKRALVAAKRCFASTQSSGPEM